MRIALRGSICLEDIQGDRMKVLLSAIAAATLLMAGSAHAVDAAAAKALAQKSGCLACHSVDAKVLGPAYKDVAAMIDHTAKEIERGKRKPKDKDSNIKPETDLKMLWEDK